MPKQFTFVIEHMEEDEGHSLPKWVLLEYKHMLSLAGQGNKVCFTHLSQSSCAAIQKGFESVANSVGTQKSSEATFEATSISILEYMKLQGVPMNRVCLLDPRGSKELSPEDGSEFEWFLFGGILGDDPPRDRTGELRALGFAGRRLGPIQMTTDTALGVTKMIVQDQMTMETIPFVDHPTIKFSKTESVEMPFRYIIKEGEPLLPGGMKQHLYDDLNRGFND